MAKQRRQGQEQVKWRAKGCWPVPSSPLKHLVSWGCSLPGYDLGKGCGAGARDATREEPQISFPYKCCPTPTCGFLCPARALPTTLGVLGSNLQVWVCLNLPPLTGNNFLPNALGDEPRMQKGLADIPLWKSAPQGRGSPRALVSRTWDWTGALALIFT